MLLQKYWMIYFRSPHYSECTSRHCVPSRMLGSAARCGTLLIVAGLGLQHASQLSLH